MKLLWCALLALALAVPAAAQWALTAQIPFDFELAGTRLPAGDYLITIKFGHNAVEVHSADGGLSVFVIARKPDAKRPGMDITPINLVFNKYGERRFLADIRHPNANRQLVKSREERELVTTRLISGLPTEKVVVLAAVR